MTQDEIIRLAREAGAIRRYWGDNKEGFAFESDEQLERFAALVAEAEGKRLDWACEQARNPDEPIGWLLGFDTCAAVLNAERIETK